MSSFIKIFFTTTVLGILLFAGTSSAYAVSQDLNGWAWSSTIGWISFNSSDPGAGGGPYKVVLDDTNPTTAPLSGWAWSSNIGWIKFSGDGSHPDPVVNMSTGLVTGWIRACSGTVNKDCNIPDRTDGWDGWIELSGTNHTSPVSAGTGGITYVSNTPNPGGVFKGYAWGSDVVGWVQFDSSVSGGGGVTLLSGTCTVSPLSPVESATPVTFTFTANPSGGTGSYTYSWNGSAYSNVNPFTHQVPVSDTYQPTLIIKDSAVPASTVTPVPNCSAVTVTNPSPAPQVQLWFESRGKPAPANMFNQPPLRVKEGQDVNVKYDWTSGLTCTGDVIQSPSGSGGWNSSPNKTKWSENKRLNEQPFIFKDLAKGTYIVRLKCSSFVGLKEHPSIFARIINFLSSIAQAQVTFVDSNDIKIIVTKSTIEEF